MGERSGARSWSRGVLGASQSAGHPIKILAGRKSLLKIRREANVGLFRLAYAPKNIDVKHARASFRFAQLRRARFAFGLQS